MRLPREAHALVEDAKTSKKLALNLKRNRGQDHTEKLDLAAASFDYAAARQEWWNPEARSLMHGTPLWHESSADQRRLLNQLYWVAYYSQIISAEVATIFFNQTSAAGLYGLEDFRVVGDTLDMESNQERAHIAAFKTVTEATEAALFGERLFTWPMRGPYAETMIFPDSGRLGQWWKSLQLRTFGLLSSGNAFIASQYLTVRGLRTLNGKMVQESLARFEGQSVPSRISHYHFEDESYHFNSSTIIGKDVVKSLAPPTSFERWVANLGVRGCQRDHGKFSVVVNGLFWHEPATFAAIYRLLRTPHFGMDHGGALAMMQRCFCEESEGLHAAAATQREARQTYRVYVEDLPWLWASNLDMALMESASIERYLATNRRAMARFVPPALVAA